MKKTGMAAAVLISLVIMAARPSLSAGRTMPAQDSKQALQHEVTVGLKLIQVYVVDKKGAFVNDLTRSDFEVYDNGKLVPLTEFEKHITPPLGKAGAGPAEDAAASPSKLNRKFFLLFDFGFNDQKGVIRAKAAGLHFIDSQVRPKDEVAVLTSSSGKGMAVHEYLTADHQKARMAIESLGMGRITGRASEIELLLDREQQMARTTDTGKTVGAEVSEAEQAERDQIKDLGKFAQGTYSQQVLGYLQNFRTMAKALRYIQGNKSLVLFSGGVARSLLFGSMDNLSKLPDEPFRSVDAIAEYSKFLETLQGDSGIQKEFRDLVQELNAASVSIYAVNETTPQAGSADPASRDLRGDEFLRQLSNSTGGRYFHNTQDPNVAMETIQDITGSYYVLGFIVDEAWDGKFHALKVAVKRKGLQTWGVGGYYNPKPFSEFTELEKRLHLIDMALSESPQFQIAAEMPMKALPAFKGTDPWLAVAAQLSAGLKKDLAGAKTEAVVFLFDEEKNLKGLKRTELNLGGEETGTSCLAGILPVQTGRFNCTLVLRNLQTGRGARSTAPVNVAAKLTAGLKFSAPLWLKAEKNGRWHDLSAKDSLFAVYPFQRDEYVPIMDEIGAGAAKIYGLLPLAFSGLNPPDIILSAQLVDQASGTRVNLPLTVLHKNRDGNTIAYFFELALGELTRGSYSVYFFAKEQLGDSRVFITNLTIR